MGAPRCDSRLYQGLISARHPSRFASLPEVELIAATFSSWEDLRRCAFRRSGTERVQCLAGNQDAEQRMNEPRRH